MNNINGIKFLSKLKSILEIYCKHNEVYGYSCIGIIDVIENQDHFDVTYICANDECHCILQDKIPTKFLNMSDCEIDIKFRF